MVVGLLSLTNALSVEEQIGSITLEAGVVFAFAIQLVYMELEGMDGINNLVSPPEH